MTHFLRTVQSYLSIEVIETQWIRFIQRVVHICQIKRWDNNGREESLVDQLIQTHEDYVASMLVRRKRSMNE